MPTELTICATKSSTYTFNSSFCDDGLLALFVGLLMLVVGV